MKPQTAQPFEIRAFVRVSSFCLQPSSLSLGVGGVEAGGVGGGVGVVELHEAVGVGGGQAEVEPVEQVGAGLDVEVLAGGALGLQEDGAVGAALQGDGGVFDGDDFCPA